MLLQKTTLVYLRRLCGRRKLFFPHHTTGARQSQVEANACHALSAGKHGCGSKPLSVGTVGIRLVIG